MISNFKPITVAICGLGAIGLPVARWLDQGVPGLKLVAVATSSVEKAMALVEGFNTPPMAVELSDLPNHADVIVEALPPERFADLAEPSIRLGRKLVVVSMTQLLTNLDLVDLAQQTGAQIIGATGALAGLDAVRAAAHSTLGRCVMRTHNPPPQSGQCDLCARGRARPVDTARTDAALCRKCDRSGGEIPGQCECCSCAVAGRMGPRPDRLRGLGGSRYRAQHP